MSLAGYLLVFLAAVAGGAVNALAGGGTLITFPMLTMAGIPPVAANVTNTVALSPGYLGAALAQLRDLRGQGRRVWYLLPAGVTGGAAGGYLLLRTSNAAFRSMVPFLILAAVVLLAFQDTLKGWLADRSRRRGEKGAHGALAVLAVLPAAVYGGYFGAGVSVIVLATLGITLDDSLTRLNALKQAVSFSCNVAAAVFFVFSGKVVWSAALVMALGAVAGGALGGRLAGRVKPLTLRRAVVAAGVVVACVYLAR